MKVYFETYGCSYNFADTNYMKSIVDFQPSSLEDAEVIVLNTCTVKNKTISNFRKKLDLIKKINPRAKVIITGCIPKAAKESSFEIKGMEEYTLLGPNNLDDIKLAISSEKVLHKLEGKKENRIKTKIHEVIEIVPISRGCLNQCTYCQTKLARGSLKSFEPKNIVKRVKEAVENGSKIIYLTSQDNGCYGFDIGTNLAELLEKLVEIEGDFKIRVGMANPQHTKKIIKPLMEIMKHPKVFKFLHIPAQSGSNAVLKHMRRGNKNEHLLKLVDFARKEIPNISLATDIIVGYSTETKEDFQKTIDMLEKVKFDVVNRAKFSARPGTEAEKLKLIQTNEVTRRSKVLDRVVKKISKEKNELWVNWEGLAIVEALKQKGTSVLRNDFYKPIVVKKELEKGSSAKVKVKKANTFHLSATLE